MKEKKTGKNLVSGQEKFPFPQQQDKKKRATFVRKPASFKLCELLFVFIS